MSSTPNSVSRVVRHDDWGSEHDCSMPLCYLVLPALELWYVLNKCVLTTEYTAHVVLTISGLYGRYP